MLRTTGVWTPVDLHDWRVGLFDESRASLFAFPDCSDASHCCSCERSAQTSAASTSTLIRSKCVSLRATTLSVCLSNNRFCFNKQTNKQTNKHNSQQITYYFENGFPWPVDVNHTQLAIRHRFKVCYYFFLLPFLLFACLLRSGGATLFAKTAPFGGFAGNVFGTSVVGAKSSNDTFFRSTFDDVVL